MPKEPKQAQSQLLIVVMKPVNAIFVEFAKVSWAVRWHFASVNDI